MASASRRVRQALGIDLAQQTHRQTRPWKRLLGEHLLGQTKFPADAPHLVLKQLAQRLDQLEGQIGRQAANVMMRLDGRGGASHGHRFDHVGVKGSLHQEPHVAEMARLHRQRRDELRADPLALDLGIGDARQAFQKSRRGVHADHPQPTRCSSNSIVWWNSFLRSSPLSTKIFVRRSPMAR